jgi:hypothetical protein
VHIHSLVLDGKGEAPGDGNAPLYDTREKNPLIAPDGHQVTLNELDAVIGSAAVSCVETGTEVDLQLAGLIPNGVYTMANLTFKSPGSDPGLHNMTGLGTLGTPDGAESDFRASPTGQATLSAITPAGSLSMLGTIGKCAFVDDFEWQIVGVYHNDGQTYGPSLGPDGSFIEQFAFVFKTPAHPALPPFKCPGLAIDCPLSDR